MNDVRSEGASLLEEARSVLESVMDACWRASYQDLLAQEGKLSESTKIGRSGNAFSVCTQIIRSNDLECALEVRGSIHHLHEDEVRPLDLRACLRVTPDDQKTHL